MPMWRSPSARGRCLPKSANTPLCAPIGSKIVHDPPRILIVDDNATNRDILATRLATQGYALCEAADGEAAITAAKSLLPDLILLDVMMPKLNGFEVCRRLKNDAALPFMTIILVT